MDIYAGISNFWYANVAMCDVFFSLFLLFGFIYIRITTLEESYTGKWKNITKGQQIVLIAFYQKIKIKACVKWS